MVQMMTKLLLKITEAKVYCLKVCLNNNVNTQVMMANGKMVIKELTTRKITLQLPTKTRLV